ncbi:CdaR family protein [Thermus altitudinis]|uniref:CdaR family protein n=1 Tax=Thermus altitudinis TaxID=2908145 RepID=UPI001FAA20CC
MRDWGSFLLALLAAFAVWYSLRERAPVVERAVSVPLQVVGLGGERTAEGVPKEVLLRLRGPAPLVEGARVPVSAYLDLSGAEGAFTREVRVAVPQGVEVLEIRPARVEGRVEAILTRTLPVEVLAQGAWVETQPAFVEAKGPKSRVEEAVVALGVDLGGETVVLAAFGPQGPLLGVELFPAQVQVVARASPLFRKEVPLVLRPPAGLRVVAFSPKTVEVVGPKEALEGLTQVEARPQGGFRPGEVVGPLVLTLPSGVRVLGEVLGRVRLALE